jgi:hypothetical protein
VRSKQRKHARETEGVLTHLLTHLAAQGPSPLLLR